MLFDNSSILYLFFSIFTESICAKGASCTLNATTHVATSDNTTKEIRIETDRQIISTRFIHNSKKFRIHPPALIRPGKVAETFQYVYNDEAETRVLNDVDNSH